jgi:hypothetical protein
LNKGILQGDNLNKGIFWSELFRAIFYILYWVFAFVFSNFGYCEPTKLIYCQECVACYTSNQMTCFYTYCCFVIFF